MNKISAESKNLITELRVQGMSIPEITRATGYGKTTVQRYVKSIPLTDKARLLLREKQGGGKDRALGLRQNCLDAAESLLGSISRRDSFLLLVGLYWGEGTKRDFSIINSDPYLLITFLKCLKDFGISEERISLSLRIHSDISESAARSFWSKTLNLPKDSISRVEIIEGKKKGKLKFGMCRIRVRSGIRERLIVQQAISIIGKESSEKVLSA